MNSIARHFDAWFIKASKTDPVREQELVDCAYYHDKHLYSYEEVRRAIHDLVHGDGGTVL